MKSAIRPKCVLNTKGIVILKRFTFFVSILFLGFAAFVIDHNLESKSDLNSTLFKQNVLEKIDNNLLSFEQNKHDFKKYHKISRGRSQQLPIILTFTNVTFIRDFYPLDLDIFESYITIICKSIVNQLYLKHLF